jgi:3-isopropylmalate dehydrogenase
MWMVKNPEWFDVIVTDNMFGDIISDLAAMIQGGMGIMAAGIMLDTLGQEKAASYIEAGVAKVLREDIKDLAAGKMGHTTAEIGDLVVEHIVNSI